MTNLIPPTLNRTTSPFIEEPAAENRIPTARLRRARQCLVELALRRQEVHRHYDPVPGALAFHKSQAYWRLLVGSNRSGKTNAAAIELVWAIANEHPYYKYPAKNFTAYVVCQREKEIKEVVWPKLAHPGSTKIIRDERNGEWRAVLPDNEYDLSYKEKWKDAPPLLPSRLLKGGYQRGVSWSSRKDDIPKAIRLANGGRVQFFTSESKPVKGSSIDFAWLDEEIENELWIPELEARCLDRGGRLQWSFTPEVATPVAYIMHQRAITPPLADGSRVWDVEEFHLLIKDNPFLENAKKQRFRQGLRTQREIDTKWFGKFAIQGAVVYPEYNADVHEVEPFEIPPEWTRYMVVDPGVQVCAVLFIAVPNPGSQQAGEVHLYDELYIRRCSASQFAEQVKNKMGMLKDGAFEAFIIDHRMARQKQTGSGETVEDHYSKELRQRGVWSRQTDSGFLWGSDDIATRESALRRWLETRYDTGKPTLRIHAKRCPNLVWEMGMQFYKRSPDGLITDKRLDKDNHAVTCLEYVAELDPGWVSPPKGTRTEPGVLRALRRLQRERQEYLNFGPS